MPEIPREEWYAEPSYDYVEFLDGPPIGNYEDLTPEQREEFDRVMAEKWEKAKS